MTHELPPPVDVYQPAHSVSFRQVSEEVGLASGSLPVFIHSDGDLSKDKIRESLLNELETRYWWFKKVWREKGMPSEQFILTVGDFRVEVFNFAQKLGDEEVDDLKKMANIQRQLGNRTDFRTILIDSDQPINKYTGESVNGEGDPSARIIKIFPNARRQIPHRIYETGNFLGTLVHEGSHQWVDINDVGLINKWIAELGWRVDIERTIQLPGGFPKSWFVDEPQRCINEYAAFAPNEDFCESLVAAVFARTRLDPQRLAFMDRELGTDKIDLEISDQIKVDRRDGENIVLPRVDEVSYYVKKIIPIVTINR